MAQDIFLKIDGIEGESMDSKHAKEIDIISWSFGVNQAGTFSVGGGGGAGKANFQDFQFVHSIDKASPKLFLNCATGAHIAKAVLVVRKAGAEQLEYLKITLSDLLVSGVTEGGAGGDGERPRESVTLNFAKIEFEYRPQKADGTLDAAIKTGYDVKQNKAV